MQFRRKLEPGRRRVRPPGDPRDPCGQRRGMAHGWVTSRQLRDGRPQASERRSRCRTDHKKCTEPVAPSSGFPTDRRRSDCHRRAINLGRSVLGASRTLGGDHEPVKATWRPTCRKLRSFLFAQSQAAHRGACSSDREREKNGRTRRPGRKSSPSRERFRPPSRRTFRFRVVLLGGLRPTGAPCSAQAEIYDNADRSDQGHRREEIPRYLRAHSATAGPTSRRLPQ